MSTPASCAHCRKPVAGPDEDHLLDTDDARADRYCWADGPEECKAFGGIAASVGAITNGTPFGGDEEITLVAPPSWGNN